MQLGFFLSFGEVTSLSSATDALVSDEDESPKRPADDVPEVVRRSIEGKAARRRLVDVTGFHGRRRRPSAESAREEGGEGGVASASHCRHCGADLGDLCAHCHAQRISLDYEVDEGVVRAIDGKKIRSISLRVLKWTRS